ncbi:MAG: hypothetical protein IBX50_08195 [Marinospirillum sp.]|uniref:hypothetical protein n=1 Tax=Marinospirillum sp. TaxID=2183934 RepID=UPI0019E01C00|nr:hypothetical protein [Marinospirillum sp.]MBE0506686.1 hypothetical protein [Marinospirillum sp.]
MNTLQIAFHEQKIDYSSELESVGEPAYRRIQGSPVGLGMPKIKQHSVRLSDLEVFEQLINEKPKAYLKRIKDHFRDLHRLLSHEYRQLRSIQRERWFSDDKPETPWVLEGPQNKSGKPFIERVNGVTRNSRSTTGEIEAIFGCSKARYLILKAYLGALSEKRLMPTLSVAEIELMKNWRPDFKISKLLDNTDADGMNMDDYILEASYLPGMISAESGTDLHLALKIDSYFQEALLELGCWQQLSEDKKSRLIGAFFAMSVITLSKSILLLIARIEPDCTSYLHGVLLFDEPEFNALTGAGQPSSSDQVALSLPKMVAPAGSGVHPVYADIIRMNHSIKKHVEQRLQSSDGVQTIRDVLDQWDELSHHSFRHLVDQARSDFASLLHAAQLLQTSQIDSAGIIPLDLGRIDSWIKGLDQVADWVNEQLESSAEPIILNELNSQRMLLAEMMTEVEGFVESLSEAHNEANALREAGVAIKAQVEAMQQVQELLQRAESQVQEFNEAVTQSFPLKPIAEYLNGLPGIQEHLRQPEPISAIDITPVENSAAGDQLYELAEVLQQENDQLKRDNLALRQRNEQLLNGLYSNDADPQWQAARMALDALVDEGASAKSIISLCQKMFADRLFFFEEVAGTLDKINRMNLPVGALAQRLFSLGTCGVDLMRENGGQLISLRNVVSAGISCQESEGVRTQESLRSLRRFTRTPGEVCEVLPHFPLGDLHRIYLRYHEERIEIAYIGKHLPIASSTTI